MKKVLVLVLTLVLLLAVTIPMAAPALACEPPPEEPPPPPLDESPGFWKNHPEAWPEGVLPGTPFNAVFPAGPYPSFPGMSLMDVLWQGGGHEKREGRELVAEYLNHYGALPPY